MLELIVFVRLLKLISLLNEIQCFVLIGETMKNLLQPLKYLLGILALILYAFAETGMMLYGGKVTMNSPQIIHDSGIPDDYYLVNFNDMFSSIITLFVLMVVNNWMVIVQMYVDISGGETSQRIFFIVFYYFGVIIGLNIIIAFAIDMYSAVERLNDNKEANREFLLKLANKVHEDSQNLGVEAPFEMPSNEENTEEDSFDYGSETEDHEDEE